MNWKLQEEIPSQEAREKWFKSHLLGREVELRELYELPQNELDLIMAETAELRSEVGNRDRNLGKFCTAGYFLELARIIDKRRSIEQ
ncbi:hypothetical protein [Prochlorococcus sp. MIT 1223]|uniref:hypothetical protein n=1 Tax=Prochlorococcus sp. MIT 1223 TaxID=3096217 RepID=UPI002A75633A|nr:hypothetical protein [Prochlorococcus sp. MIT 1223]